MYGGDSEGAAIVIIWPVAPCHSQMAAVIDGWLWEYGVTS